ncbi:MAG: hypothetical protein ACPGQL_05345 [Thermoplasmatota archaeon]
MGAWSHVVVVGLLLVASAGSLAAPDDSATSVGGLTARHQDIAVATAWASQEPSLEGAVRVAQEILATKSGIPPGTPAAPDLAAPSLPSEALAPLLERFGIVPDGTQQQQIDALDHLDQRARVALARLLVAFDAYERAVAANDTTATLLGQGRLLEVGLELASLPSWLWDAGVLRLPPLLILDVWEAGSVHAQDVALLLDVGGDDLYVNNAGGSGIDLPAPAGSLAVADRCAMVQGFGRGLTHVGRAAAAFDLAGDDRYLPGKGCGVNGGGYRGAGLLFDAQGKDRYVAGASGPCVKTDLLVGHIVATCGGNGGAYWGHGLLVDGGGSDRYDAHGGGTNGGAAYPQATGLLVDAWGNDRYDGGGVGVNGGAHYAAQGSLVDLRGSDTYLGLDGGVNGGGDGASGTLIDAGGGNDTYVGRDESVNGGAAAGGRRTIETVTLLPDFLNGRGLLLDDGGDDTYTARSRGVNGGGVGAHGLLLDLGGGDDYSDRQGGTGSDRTIWVKGTVGHQVDVSASP